MTTIIVAVIAAFVLGMIFKSFFKAVLDIIFALTIGPWYLLIKSKNSSTGNGVGAMAALLGFVGIAIQLILAIVILIGVGIYFLVR